MSYYGVIMDIEDNEAVVMTDESRFIIIEKSEEDYIGKKVIISDRNILYEKNEKNKAKRKLLYALAGVAAVFVFVMIFYVQQTLVSHQIYAYIGIDINPSVELAVDNKIMVEDIAACNKDAQKLLEQKGMKGKDLNGAFDRIVECAIKNNYIKNTGKNIILVSTTIMDKEGEKQKIREENAKILDNLLGRISQEMKKKNIEIVNLQISSEEWKLAKKAGVTAGRYHLYLDARKKDPNITIEEVEDRKISELVGNLSEDGDEDSSRTNDKATGQSNAKKQGTVTQQAKPTGTSQKQVPSTPKITDISSKHAVSTPKPTGTSPRQVLSTPKSTSHYVPVPFVPYDDSDVEYSTPYITVKPWITPSAPRMFLTPRPTFRYILPPTYGEKDDKKDDEKDDEHDDGVYDD